MVRVRLKYEVTRRNNSMTSSGESNIRNKAEDVLLETNNVMKTITGKLIT
jgi:hypothetical protein